MKVSTMSNKNSLQEKEQGEDSTEHFSDEVLQQDLLAQVIEEDFMEVWQELKEEASFSEEKAQRFFEAEAVAILQRLLPNEKNSQEESEEQ